MDHAVAQRQGFCVAGAVDVLDLLPLTPEHGRARDGDSGLPVILGEGGGEPKRESWSSTCSSCLRSTSMLLFKQM